ncbi:MAG: (2Fe-2S)-binding protein [Clostridia bacterium]|nr:(2Fe-2S)-binding protein [Clostridia bacterium]
MKKQIITLNINGEDLELRVAPTDLLVDVLRKEAGLTGTKIGCGQGDCGACTVIIDGKAVLSCLTLAMACQGKKITTIEGIADQKTGEMNPIQKSFLNHGAVQCGYCTPGMVMSSYNLLSHNPKPTRGEIKRALSGNLCRCTGYILIFEAVEACAAEGGVL